MNSLTLWVLAAMFAVLGIFAWAHYYYPGAKVPPVAPAITNQIAPATPVVPAK